MTQEHGLWSPTSCSWVSILPLTTEYSLYLTGWYWILSKYRCVRLLKPRVAYQKFNVSLCYCFMFLKLSSSCQIYSNLWKTGFPQLALRSFFQTQSVLRGAPSFAVCTLSLSLNLHWLFHRRNRFKWNFSLRLHRSQMSTLAQSVPTPRLIFSNYYFLFPKCPPTKPLHPPAVEMYPS